MSVVELRAGPAPSSVSARFGLDVWRDGGDFRIDLSGTLDRTAVPRLRAALGAAEASDAEFVLLDLRGLVSIDGAGIRAILTTHYRLGTRRALLLLRGPHPLRHLLEAADVEQPLFLLD